MSSLKHAVGHTLGHLLHTKAGHDTAKAVLAATVVAVPPLLPAAIIGAAGYTVWRLFRKS